MYIQISKKAYHAIKAWQNGVRYHGGDGPVPVSLAVTGQAMLDAVEEEPLEEVHPRLTLAERYLAGEIDNLDLALEDAVSAWHDNTLEDWLGLTEEEYAMYLRHPAGLQEMLDARKKG